LVVTDPVRVAALKSKGGDPKTSVFDGTQYHMINTSAFDLMRALFGDRLDTYFNKTGIDFKIDIKLEGSMTDMKEAKRELNKNGFDIVKEEKDMKVLVIRDSVL
jgi:hypothetical protein